MGKYYSGKFNPKNLLKYDGDYTNITYRSLWERQVLRWCDENPNVVKYCSEEVVVPYMCKTDSRMHRYFVDLKITFATGAVYLIEIKPKKETVQPKKPTRQTKRYITEVMTYVKNQSKWTAADIYAQQRGWIFEVWHEDTLKSLGIKIIIERAPKPKKKKV